MKLLKATFIILISIKFAFAVGLDDRRKKIVGIIDEELSEVSRLSKQTGSRNPDHLLRMAELNLEKARLWREKENQVYIALPNKVRQKTNKKNHFKTSARYFSEANRLCILITRRFKRYSSIGDVYYILGFNAKEAGKNKTALKYFSKASKKSKGNNITKVKSQIALAELYYNKKQYRKAIPLYEKSLNKFKDKWWTKDSFNLAWCYFRNYKYGKSISKMKEVFKRSSSSKYVDMRPAVERDIGLVFATAGRIEEGIAFYKKIGINFTDQLLRIAVAMKSKGQYTLASKTLRYALKYEKNPKRFGEIYIEQLDLFASYSKRKSHLSTSKKLFNLYKKNLLTKNQVKTLIFQTAKQGAILQKQAAGKTYKRLKNKRSEKANAAISYFGMLKEIEKNKNFEYAYLQAETAFVVGKYSRAVRFYDEAFNMSVKSKNRKFMGRSMEGLLATLGQRRLTKKVKENYYVPVYEKYLANYPKGKRAKSIYQKLFKVYLERKQYDKSKSVLDRFVKVYGKDWKTQEAMIAELMEVNRKKKQNNKIRAWINDIDKKKYVVSKKYAKKLRELLTSMQIEDVQLDLKKGNKKKALVGYHNILKDPNSTKRSKMNAKYNLAALYYEMGAVDNSFKWSNEALDEMSSKDTVQFADSFITISTYMFTRLEFQKSAALASKIVTKLCKIKSRKKSIAFKNGAFMLLAEEDMAGTQKIISLGERCNVPRSYIDNIRFETLKDYELLQQWNNFEIQINKLSKRKSNWPKLIIPLDTLSRVHRNIGNIKKSNELNYRVSKYYASSKKLKKDIPLAALTLISNKEIKKLEKIQSRIITTKLRYPASSFQKIMQKKLKWLDQLVAKASVIQKIGSGDGIVKTFKVLIETHKAFANEVKSFVPPGMKPKNIPLFQKDMKKQIYGPLLTQAYNYEKDAWMSIEQNEILSINNSSISSKLENVPIRYWYPDKAIMMDRGGVR
jgi:tetratricopeptide (TPR) repeat protein